MDVAPPLYLHLRNRAEAPRAARAALNGVADLHPDVRATAALLISELVTNSVRHAGGGAADQIEVAISVDGVLHVEVADGGAGIPPEVLDAGPEADGGRGLFIVSRLARRWGAERGGGVVWFELDLAPGAGPAAPGAPPFQPGGG
jgi:two-component sensor histidine kinase